MAGVSDVAFDEHAAVGKVGLGEAPHRIEGGRQFVDADAHLHADATPAGAALEHHRVADATGLGQRRANVSEQAAAGQQGHLHRSGQVTRRVFEAEDPHLPGRRADEGQPRAFAEFDELRVL